MRTPPNRKEILLYALSMAVLLLLLKWLEARWIVFNYRLELFVGAIALLFTALGIWVALKLARPKTVTQVVEKKIFVSEQKQRDEALITKLGLSKRELDVLELMAEGLSNEEIAVQLFVSLNTVKTHASNIFAKLDVKRRTQAAEKAKRLNIIG